MATLFQLLKSPDEKVDTTIAPASAYLSVLGMTGLTAYFGLLDIGQPKKKGKRLLYRVRQAQSVQLSAKSQKLKGRV